MNHHLWRLSVLCLWGFAVTLGDVKAAEAPPELKSEPYLFEVMRHLYRWYMDEKDVESSYGKENYTVWVRALDPVLDPGDRSRLGEIVLPALGICVTVKKADYSIPEMNFTVSNNTFKITHVARSHPADEAEYEKVSINYARMEEYLLRTRSQAEFPDDALMNRLRLAVVEELRKNEMKNPRPKEPGEQVSHISPLSPVANEIWVFWETGRLLIHFSSDIDLANPAVWEHEGLTVRLYDVDDQVVVSLDEVSGSNAYMTRDQAGRALLNCVVLGKRLALVPVDPSTNGVPAGRILEKTE
ncbi:MAG: hypothetical protein V2A34_00540 [Lentisphaerota bacterium]